MSDLRPEGVRTLIGGQEHRLLFTIGTIDEIQEQCNMPLADTAKAVIDLIEGKTDTDTLTTFYRVLAALLNGEDGGSRRLEDVDGLIEPLKFRSVAWKIMEAYGISQPEPDEDDEDDEEEENPNPPTGR